MSKGLERLKEIGAQKIYEETHIPIEHVQAIIHESFDGFSRVQFLGFVSILEREYNEDLSDLRAHGLENFEPLSDTLNGDSVFISPKRKKRYTFLYILLALLAIGSVAYMKLYLPQEATEVPDDVNSVVVNIEEIAQLSQKSLTDENLTTDLSKSSSEANATTDMSAQSNATDARSGTEAPKENQESALEPTSLKLSSNSKLWIGYIDVATNRHYNKIFQGDFSLDANKSWLLVFGHKFVEIHIDESVVEVKKQESLRFLYEDGKVEPLTLQEFKRLNRGRTW